MIKETQIGKDLQMVPKTRHHSDCLSLRAQGSKTVWVMQATQDNTEIADSESAHEFPLVGMLALPYHRQQETRDVGKLKANICSSLPTGGVTSQIDNLSNLFRVRVVGLKRHRTGRCFVTFR